MVGRKADEHVTKVDGVTSPPTSLSRVGETFATLAAGARIGTAAPLDDAAKT
jgi:hypothetical protein